MTNLDENKPLEFWVDPTETSFITEEDFNGEQKDWPCGLCFSYYFPETTHVIEFAAFADQQKKIEKLEKAVELMRSGLNKHYEYAQECRGDWSEYDGRTHLSFASHVNYTTLAEVDSILKGAE